MSPHFFLFSKYDISPTSVLITGVDILKDSKIERGKDSNLEVHNKISKDFIPTEKTKYIANNVRDQLADAKIRLSNYEEFKPQFDAIDDFIVNTLANLPKYIKKDYFESSNF